ncbi:MAG: hypothetical protein ACU84Q_08205 [Gammaproteobacteria bacterium]
MLEVDFKGPYSLLASQNRELLFSSTEARGSGVFFWTFEHKQAHRIHYVARSSDSVVKDNLQLMNEVMLGERAIYEPEKLEEGTLEIAVDASSDIEKKCAASTLAFQQLERINVFAAPTCKDLATDKLIANGILSKLLNFGDIPTAWLAHELRGTPLEKPKIDLTVRFRRPVFIASLPDEMYL